MKKSGKGNMKKTRECEGCGRHRHGKDKKE
jgi:hypothetical protein